MSARSGKRIIIHPHSSRRLIVIVCLLHVLSVWLLLNINMPLIFHMTGIVFISIGAGISLYDAAKSHPSLSLRQGDANSLKLYIDSDWQAADVTRVFTNSSLLAMRVRLGSKGKNCAFVYLPDSLPADDFRQLKIFLLRLAA